MAARLFLILCVLATASPAFANATVVVLGFRSVEGDDEMAKDLTEQVRGAAKGVSGWTVSGAAVSMSQMTLVHGCDDVDAACLSEIAKGLQVERIVYGTLRRNSARADYDFVLNVNLYDAEQARIVREVDDTFPRTETDFASLGKRADKLIARLTASTAGGAIAVHANVPDADVIVNGTTVGATRAGVLRVDNLEAGQYRVEVKREGYSTNVTTVSVAASAEVAIEAELSPVAAPTEATTSTDHGVNDGGHHLKWLGWSLIGLGGASAVGWVASLVVIDGVNSDPLLKRYSGLVYAHNESEKKAGNSSATFDSTCAAATDHGYADTLTEAEFQGVVDTCKRGSTFNVLQWVFLGTAIAAGAGGAVLVLTAQPEWTAEPEAAREPTFALTPEFGPQSGQLTATLRL
jgi:hypothetical protein